MKKYRSELKFKECDKKLCVIKQLISGVLPLDSHSNGEGKYYIHSLYFDDYKNSCAVYNVSGEGQRYKWRIRYYGNNSDRLWLEKKEKKNSYCYKQKCALSNEEYIKIVSGNLMEVFWHTQNKLLKEFCVAVMSKRIVPKVIIDYERTAFVEPVNNIRITFDYNITASDEIANFLNGNYLKIPIMEKDMHILEVKFDDILPSYITRILRAQVLIQQSFSKYYLGRLAIQNKKKFMKII